MLSLSGVSASYGAVPAVSDISIEVGEGEAVGLLGANGAGKSTTLRAISGLVKMSSGMITFASTVMPPNGRATWNVRTRPWAQMSHGRNPTSSRPKAVIEPESGR